MMVESVSTFTELQTHNSNSHDVQSPIQKVDSARRSLLHSFFQWIRLKVFARGNFWPQILLSAQKLDRNGNWLDKQHFFSLSLCFNHVLPATGYHGSKELSLNCQVFNFKR